MDKVYGVMLIGCGHIGEDHLADIYYRDNIHIVAVVDIDDKRAKLFQKKYNADHWGTDYREFLDLPELDIVIIATYVNTHLSILKDCVAAHKHVLCEKPIAATREEGREFYKVAKNADVKVLVAHILRYNATYEKICDLIWNGEIGELKVARMSQNHHALNWPRYKRLLEDCSPILDCGIHYMDIIQWFTGSKIREVMGYGTTVDTDLDPGVVNYGMIVMRLQNGGMAYYEAGWGQTFSSANVKEFIGTKGRIRLTMNAQRGTDCEMGDRIELFRLSTGETETINVQCKYKDMYRQLCGLIDMIEGRPTRAPDIEQVYSAFKVAVAADKAVRESANVIVEDNW
ncbi:MAG: Gfo/Idh/MocA family oxidoreductase [Clostridia bacterium]|nr:Gfo/Idh/MocA family oxidoreductase [Clostridia bacterium]